MNKPDNKTTLDELKKLVINFRKERGWDKHFTPKNVATSISIEAAELLEHFQWDQLIKEDKEEISKELADVLIFAFHFATLYDIDISTVFQKKLSAAAKKYPVEVFNGESDDTDNYHSVKKKYRQKS
jgi:dCTP diphosphatase